MPVYVKHNGEVMLMENKNLNQKHSSLKNGESGTTSHNVKGKSSLINDIVKKKILKMSEKNKKDKNS